MSYPAQMPFASMLVPLDGSRLAESVLPVVILWAGRFQPKLTLVHIIEERVPATIHGEHHLASVAEAEVYLRQVAERLRSAGVSQVAIHVHASRQGDVARSIVDHAEEIGADLVVLCTHGSGGLRDLIYGSIAQQVLRRGSWPILLMPPRLDAPKVPVKLERILVLLDGKPSHDHPALRTASAVAAGFGAQLHLVLGVPTLETLSGRQALSGRLLPSATRAVLDLAQQEAAEYLQEQSSLCCAADVSISTEVVRGDPVRAVPDLAERLKPDLVVLASHGRAGLDALLAGSVAPRLTERLGQLLLIVRAAAESNA